MATKIEADNPLNLWLANTRAELFAARIGVIEQILRSDLSEPDKIKQALLEIDRLNARREASQLEDTYEGAVGALVRD